MEECSDAYETYFYSRVQTGNGLLGPRQGFSIREVCEQFDLQDGALRRWVNQVKFERNGGVPEAAALTPEQQEIQALKAKINELEREKSILKKATALLVSEEIDRSH